ncbi:MAG: nucleotidyltransferase family protein [Candidatus Micrarchaeota archaeon]|nr:nucleotidyltransferase family protein [Candidatus Micrarchaeota archaeon]MDE1847556.1 nucleotidyltransferase family protein [Candidatus Micrarchaeota archaeon]MDE1864273.1 nucleotidyltransferase family protein [Candidatus Micrarchaeota archaeon]
MHSIILAAGQGSRMAPLSYYIPKLLIPVKGKPILSYLLENMKGLDIDTHYIVASKNITTITTYLEKAGIDNVKVVQALGWETGGDLSIAMEEISREDEVIVLNGDLITDIPVHDMWKFHKEKGSYVTMALFTVPELEEAKRLGVAELDQDKKITKFVEKPSEIKSLPAYVNAGIYIFDKKFMQKRREYLVPKKFKIESTLFPKLVDEGKLYGYVSNFKYWWDVGTMESYLHAENFMASKGGVIPP